MSHLFNSQCQPLTSLIQARKAGRTQRELGRLSSRENAKRSYGGRDKRPEGRAQILGSSAVEVPEGDKVEEGAVSQDSLGPESREILTSPIRSGSTLSTFVSTTPPPPPCRRTHWRSTWGTLLMAVTQGPELTGTLFRCLLPSPRSSTGPEVSHAQTLGRRSLLLFTFCWPQPITDAP